VHGADEVVRVRAASAALFGAGALEDLDEPTLRAALEQAPSVTTAAEAPLVVELLAESLGLSRSDARRAVQSGGAYVNNRRVVDEAAVLTDADWLHGRFAVLRRGKRSVAVAERAS
jgi:tyrosyl-tRNA synthetase